MRQVDCILLVDDDPTTNFLNEELIDDLGIAKEIHVTWNGQEALDYIHGTGKFVSKKGVKYPRPNIIFLDINMPVMDGFVFLDHYANIPKSKRADVIVVFLTTSDAQEDREKVSGSIVVADFLEKPLRKDALMKIVQEYFDL